MTSSAAVSVKINLADSPVALAMKDGRVTSRVVTLDCCGPRLAYDGFKRCSARTRSRGASSRSSRICKVVSHRVGEDVPGVLIPDTSAPGSAAAAADLWALVPAVGQDGNLVPLQTFTELLQGIGRAGSRAHTLQQRCVP
jgi:hypothetical protein